VAPAFDVLGWMGGGEAKRSEWLMDHGGRPPAYFVPTRALNTIETLYLEGSDKLKEALTIQAGLLHKAQDELRRRDAESPLDSDRRPVR